MRDAADGLGRVSSVEPSNPNISWVLALPFSLRVVLKNGITEAIKREVEKRLQGGNLARRDDLSTEDKQVILLVILKNHPEHCLTPEEWQIFNGGLGRDGLIWVSRSLGR
jgi:hypothetical protein